MKSFTAEGKTYHLTGEPYICQNSDCPLPILQQDLIDEDGMEATCEWDCHSFGEEDINDMSDFTTVWWEGDEYDIH